MACLFISLVVSFEELEAFNFGEVQFLKQRYWDVNYTIHIFKVYSSTVLVYSQVCAAFTTTDIRAFSSPQEETPHPLTSVSYTPSPVSHPGQHQSTSHENRVTQRVPALQPFNSQVTLPCVDMPHLFVYSQMVNIWGISPSGCSDDAAADSYTQVFTRTCVFLALRCMPRGEAAGSFSTYILNAVRNSRTVFQSDCSTSDPQQQGPSAPFLCALTHLCCCPSSIIAVLVGVKWGLTVV